MAEKAFSCRAAGRRRGRLRHGGAVIVVAAVIALAGTACTAASSGPVAAGLPPPAVMVLKQGADNGNGDIFIAPGGGYPSGPEIITNTGKVVWFHPLPAGGLATDFRTQTYLGQPVLTWWQGTGSAAPRGGTDYIYNDRYQQIATVKAAQRVPDRLPRVPHHAVEHRADPGRPARDRQPDLHRRPGRPGRSSTASCRRSTSDRPGAVPVEQRRPRALPRQPAARGRARPACRGTGSTSTPSTWTPTATC